MSLAAASYAKVVNHTPRQHLCIVRACCVCLSVCSLSFSLCSPRLRFLGTAPVCLLLLPHTMLLGSWGRKERPTFPGPGPPAVCRADRICGGGRQPM